MHTGCRATGTQDHTYYTITTAYPSVNAMCASRVLRRHAKAIFINISCRIHIALNVSIELSANKA